MLWKVSLASFNLFSGGPMLISTLWIDKVSKVKYFTLCRTSYHSLTGEEISVKGIQAMCQKRHSVYSVNKNQLQMVLYFELFDLENFRFGSQKLQQPSPLLYYFCLINSRSTATTNTSKVVEILFWSKLILRFWYIIAKHATTNLSKAVEIPFWSKYNFEILILNSKTWCKHLLAFQFFLD